MSMQLHPRQTKRTSLAYNKTEVNGQVVQIEVRNDGSNRCNHWIEGGGEIIDKREDSTNEVGNSATEVSKDVLDVSDNFAAFGIGNVEDDASSTEGQLHLCQAWGHAI